METTGPAASEKHLVRDRRAVAWLPPGSSVEDSQRGRDVQLLEQRRRAARAVSVRWILLLASLTLLHAADLQLFEAVEPHMGTLFRIKLYAADEQQAKSAFRAAFDRIGSLDAILSDYKPDSELNQISQNPLKISDDLFRVLTASQ